MEQIPQQLVSSSELNDMDITIESPAPAESSQQKPSKSMPWWLCPSVCFLGAFIMNWGFTTKTTLITTATLPKLPTDQPLFGAFPFHPSPISLVLQPWSTQSDYHEILRNISDMVDGAREEYKQGVSLQRARQNSSRGEHQLFDFPFLAGRATLVFDLADYMDQGFENSTFSAHHQAADPHELMAVRKPALFRDFIVSNCVRVFPEAVLNVSHLNQPGSISARWCAQYSASHHPVSWVKSMYHKTVSRKESLARQALSQNLTMQCLTDLATATSSAQNVVSASLRYYQRTATANFVLPFGSVKHFHNVERMLERFDVTLGSIFKTINETVKALRMENNQIWDTAILSQDVASLESEWIQVLSILTHLHVHDKTRMSVSAWMAQAEVAVDEMLYGPSTTI